MNIYRLEYDNGLTATIRSKKRLQDIRINFNQEGLRSILWVNGPVLKE